MPALLNTFQRLRHSRGFGIHSPYAYRFVEEVIRPGNYGFYAFDSLDSDESLSPRIASKAKWLIRIAIFMNAKRLVAFYPSESYKFLRRNAELLYDALLPAAQALEIHLLRISNFKDYVSNPGDLLLFFTEEISSETIRNLFNSGIPMLFINPCETGRKIITSPFSHGLMLEDADKILLIPRKEMAYTAYLIKF